ncbi:MmgE/PrpD family protein [Bacillus sp. EB600]|uniref:MmgE/PrpD family protein n=1 Tax=Bacillus sp. EB600 TaxID=2806345 RepID=UPI00210DE95B|nr:MmgE/PrpD family protein [Bacillus sp. EB600]MCQ6278489.1 MmgE/PrpD family protein [Bacillus sp. EB600]
MSIKNFTEMLEYLLNVKWEDIQDSTIERAKWMIADTLFAAWYGVRSPEIQRYIQNAGTTQRDPLNTIPIVGTNFYTTPSNSAMIHGTAMVCNELDEGNQFAKGHPASHLFAPAFIAAIQNDVSGRDFIRAFIIGYEAAARLAYASNMNDDMHPHGTWGIIGGTTAAGLLQQKDNKEIIEAVLLSATFPLATSWEAAATGMTARNLYTGLGSLHAWQALELQAYGFQSSAHVIDHVWGEIMSKGIDYDLFLKDLWSPPLLEKNYFKLYPSCRFTHSAIDALVNCMLENDIDVSQVSSVLVETYGLAARLGDPDPKNRLASKFSIPFVLSALLHGNTLFDSDKEPVFSDPSIRRLAKRILVKEDPDMTAMLPDKRAARVTLKMSDGIQVSSFVRDASGGYDQPLPKNRLVEKFENMLNSTERVEKVELVLQATMQLDKIHFKQWLELIMNKSSEEYRSEKVTD